MSVLSYALTLLLMVLPIGVVMAAGAPDEVVIADFEAAALPVSPNNDGGKAPTFVRSTEAPHSGKACLHLDYTGGARYGNLQLPASMTGTETAVRFWVKKIQAEPKAAMHIWLFEADGDAWLSPSVNLADLGDGWQKVEIPIARFAYQPRGNGEQELITTNRMLIGCNFANFTVDVDDICFVVPDPSKKWFGTTSAPTSFTFDLTKPSSDWWGTLTAEYDPIQFMAESTSPNLGRRGMNESWWTVEQERVRKMGLHGMRLWFQIDWWEPFPHRLMAGPAAKPYDGFDVDGPRMRSVYRFLDMCQKYDVEVMLNFGWKMDLPTRYWLAPPDQIGRSNPDINNADAHAESLVSLLKYLHDVKKYTVVTHVTLGNEWEYNYSSLYEAIQKRLVADGIRDRYVIAGLESNRGIKGSHDLAAAHPELIDVHTVHDYGTMDIGKLVAYDKAVLSDLPKGAGPQSFGKRGRILYTELALGPSSGVDIAGAVAGSACEGAYGVGGWRLGDQHLVSVCAMGHGSDRFDHGLHQWGTWEWIPWMKKPRESYFAASLLTRYTRRNSNIFVPAEANISRNCVLFEKDGDYTLLMVNGRKAACTFTVHLGKDLKKPFFRHLFDTTAISDSSYDTIIPKDKEFTGGTISDELPPRTFAVYTTFADLEQIEITPYVSVVKPGVTIALKAKVIPDAGEVRWSVDGGSANGSIGTDGVFHAPAGLPAIDPVIVRATGRRGGVGLAIMSFSGQPQDQPSRPSVAIKDRVGHGSSRMFDLGTSFPLDATQTLNFRMSNDGPDAAPFAITTSVPWLKVTPSEGTIEPKQAQTIDARISLDTHGLKPGAWYRGYVDINSPRGLGHDQLEVFFKTKE